MTNSLRIAARMAAKDGCWGCLVRKPAEKGAEDGCWERLLFEKSSPLQNLFLFFPAWARGLSNPFFMPSSDIENCGKTQSFNVAEQPFRHFAVVGHPKLRYSEKFCTPRAAADSSWHVSYNFAHAAAIKLAFPDCWLHAAVVARRNFSFCCSREFLHFEVIKLRLPRVKWSKEIV